MVSESWGGMEVAGRILWQTISQEGYFSGGTKNTQKILFPGRAFFGGGKKYLKDTLKIFEKYSKNTLEIQARFENTQKILSRYKAFLKILKKYSRDARPF